MNKQHKVLMYALSTCGWCKRAKRFLINHKIEFEYIDVDRSSQEDLHRIEREILNRGGKLIFPTLIIDDQILMTNPREEELLQALEIE